MTSTTATNRETWLNNLATMMAPRFEELGHPVPSFRVSIGFTSGGKNTNAAAECWHSSASADGKFEILISPVMDDSMDVAGNLAHELIHAAVGFKHNHRGPFEKMALALGLQRPMTATTPGPAFREWCQPFIDELGPVPHARLRVGADRIPGAAGADGEDGAEGERDSSNAKKKQSTRLLKAACAHEHDGKPCGYTVRLSKKWALELGAACPVHGSMEVEGLDDAPDGGEDGE